MHPVLDNAYWQARLETLSLDRFVHVLDILWQSILHLPAWSMILMVISAAAFSWVLISHSYALLRTRRLIQDTPTAKIRSAPQGMIELQGRARGLNEVAQKTPITNQDCVWYAYSIEREIIDTSGRMAWQILKTHTQDCPFIIQDDTGCCVVVPTHAQINTSKNRRWIGQHLPAHLQTTVSEQAAPSRYRFFEASISTNDRVYVQGYFQTVKLQGKPLSTQTMQAEITRKIQPYFNPHKPSFAQWTLPKNRPEEQASPPLTTELMVNTVSAQRTLNIPLIIANFSQKKLARIYLWKAILYMTLLIPSLTLPLWIVIVRLA